MSGQTSDFAAIGVGIPANDEAGHIERCLESVIAAARLVDWPVTVVVAVDASRDDTADRARRTLHAVQHLGGAVVETSFRSAGAARAAALDASLERTGRPPEAVWLATTDADTVVDRTWLQVHQRWAMTGVDGVAGLVEVDWPSATSVLAARYARSIAAGGTALGHPHVHGANLGLRAHRWKQVGGCGAGVVSEDHELWRRLRAAGATVLGVDDLIVRTSARLAGRAPNGFSHYLQQLLMEAPVGLAGFEPATS